MIKFIKSIFSENGEGSYSRVFSGIITISVLVWVSHVVWHTNAIPDLGGPTEFILGSVGIHYGVNKINDFVKDARAPQAPTPTLIP